MKNCRINRLVNSKALIVMFFALSLFFSVRSEADENEVRILGTWIDTSRGLEYAAIGDIYFKHMLTACTKLPTPTENGKWMPLVVVRDGALMEDLVTSVFDSPIGEYFYDGGSKGINGFDQAVITFCEECGKNNINFGFYGRSVGRKRAVPILFVDYDLNGPNPYDVEKQPGLCVRKIKN